MAAAGVFPGAIHAFWVLSAFGELDPATASRGFASSDAKVRATAVRVSEDYLRAEEKNELTERIPALAKDPAFDVQLQVMFSLGESKSPQAETAMLELLEAHPEYPLIRDAAISGLNGRELGFLSRMLERPVWNQKSANREETIKDLAQCVAESRDGNSVSKLLDLIAARESRWQQLAMLDGITALIPPRGRAKTAPVPKAIRLSSSPAALAKLASAKDNELNERLGILESLLVWPGKPGYVEPVIKPLSQKEQELFEAGKAQYPLICGACHQPSGRGLEGLAPPLVDSDWVTGSPARLARIVLNGVRGKLNVKGRTWELEMPPVNVLSDDEIAGLLTYIRREWEHNADPIQPEFVAKVRAETSTRQDAWTEPELLKVE
jgi:mono/diheme cytochrome c family protein